jgi:hypothetical protein
MKLGFNKFLEKKFGSEFKEKRESMIKGIETKVKLQEQEKLKIQGQQKNLLKDLVRDNSIIYVDGQVYNKEKYRCLNIIRIGADKKEKECGQEMNLIDLLFFDKIPPMLQSTFGNDEKDILNWIHETGIVKSVKCSCGRRYFLSNRKG